MLQLQCSSQSDLINYEGMCSHMLKWLTRLEHLPVLLEPLKVVELNVNFFFPPYCPPAFELP